MGTCQLYETHNCNAWISFVSNCVYVGSIAVLVFEGSIVDLGRAHDVLCGRSTGGDEPAERVGGAESESGHLRRGNSITLG